MTVWFFIALAYQVGITQAGPFATKLQCEEMRTLWAKGIGHSSSDCYAGVAAGQNVEGWR